MDKTVFNEHLLDLKKQVIKVELRINSYSIKIGCVPRKGLGQTEWNERIEGSSKGGP